MKDSGLFKLQWKDIAKAFIVTAGGALLPTIYSILNSDHFPTWPEFRPSLMAAISCGLTYVIKNFVTNNNGEILKKNKEMIEVPAKEVLPAYSAPKDSTVK